MQTRLNHTTSKRKALLYAWCQRYTSFTSSQLSILTVLKPKAAPASAAGPSTSKAPATPAPATTATPVQPAAPSHASTAATVAAATPSPAGAATSSATETPTLLNDPSALAIGAERQEAIANLESMGFPRSEIEIAMRAAFYNPERAAEYLMDVRTLKLC
jgi:UV excision repair protein RAD23